MFVIVMNQWSVFNIHVTRLVFLNMTQQLKCHISKLYVIVIRDQHRANKQHYWLTLTLMRSMGVAKNRSINESINNIANVEM